MVEHTQSLVISNGGAEVLLAFPESRSWECSCAAELLISSMSTSCSIVLSTGALCWEGSTRIGCDWSAVSGGADLCDGKRAANVFRAENRNDIGPLVLECDVDIVGERSFTGMCKSLKKATSTQLELTSRCENN